MANRTEETLLHSLLANSGTAGVKVIARIQPDDSQEFFSVNELPFPANRLTGTIKSANSIQG